MLCSDFLNQYQSTWSEPEAPETNWSEPETPETNRRSETELSSQHGFIKTGLQPKQNGTTLDLGIRLGPMLRVKNNITLISKSDLFISEPVPKSLQPKFYNLVLICKSYHMPYELLKVLQKVESKLGRIRLGKNMKRCLDLDLIDFNNRIKNSLKLVIPHPRMHLRKFVLYPLNMIYPSWCHPMFKKNLYYYLKKIYKQKVIKINNIDFEKKY